MQAVVLAAGDGGRLLPLTAGAPKPLLPLRGRPIIHHVLESLHAAGVDDATIVVGYYAGRMRRALAGAAPAGMKLRFVENADYALGNARSLWAARDAIDSPFVLAMGDHVVEPALIRSLVDGAGACGDGKCRPISAFGRADGRCRLAVDRASADDSRAAEATRARVRDGRVVDLGKQLDNWNALDTGVFWCTPRVFDALTPPLRDGEAGDVFRVLAHAGELDAVDVTGRRWVDIDTEQDLRDAEAMLAGRGDGHLV